MMGWNAQITLNMAIVGIYARLLRCTLPETNSSPLGHPKQQN